MDVVIHLGAHRTGSTALQRSLAAGAETLAAGGVRYAPREAMRRPLVAAMLTAELYGPIGRGARRLAAARLRAWARRQEAAGWTRLILSEEELAGSMDACLTGEGLYPMAAPRLELLAGALAPWRVHALAALREPGEWTASAWGFSASRRAPRPGGRRDLDRVRRAWLEGGRGWAAFAADIQGAFGAAAFWRADLYATRPRRVHRLLAGEAGAELRRAGGRKVNAGPSAPAMAELASRRAAGRRTSRRELHALLGRYPPAKHPPFDPWSAAEREALAARWAEEVAEIRARGMSVIEPQAPAQGAGAGRAAGTGSRPDTGKDAARARG